MKVIISVFIFVSGIITSAAQIVNPVEKFALPVNLSESSGAIFFKIARDEVFYLCGNFSAGVMKSSVVRQLDTANRSSYTHSVHESGSTIVFSSRLYFVSNQCVIELDKNEKVTLTVFK